MKKNYQKPVMLVVNIQQSEIICGSDTSVGSVGGGTLQYGGSSTNNTSGQIRSRGGSIWEDDDE